MITAPPRWIVVSLGLTGLLIVFYAARAVTGFGGAGLEAFTSRWIYDLAHALPVLALLSRAALPGRDRVAFGLLGVAAALTVAGDMVWNEIYEESGDVPIPSVADVLYVSAYVPMALSVVWFLRGRSQRLQSGLWVDGLLCALAVGTVFAVVVIEPINRSLAGETSISYLTQVTYPLGDLLVVGGFVGACALRGWRVDLRWLLLCGGAFIYVATDATYLVQVYADTYVNGGLLDIGWLLSGLVWALAAWSDPAPVDELAPARRLTVVAPVVFGMTAALTFFFEALESDADRIALCLGFATICVAFARFALTSRENVRLLAASRQDAVTDPLTGLANRRRLDADLAQIEEPRVLVSFDLDGFKLYNDTFGHPAGDGLLRMIGETLGKAVGGEGTAFRVGGDEFCALVASTGEDPEAVGRRLAAALRQSGTGFDVTASFGVVRLPAEAATAEAALRLADRRLYAHKHSRRASADGQSSAVLLAVLSERDPNLGDHVDHVAGLAEAVARRLGMEDAAVDEVRRAAALHDIGKIAIPEALLNKAAPLDEDELALMRQHAVIGERVLSAAPSLAKVAALVRASHERWDGGGYPDGLAGEEIPLGARVIFVCDAFDAMTVERPYKRLMTADAALAELRRCAGTQFDADVVEAFAAVYAESAAVAVAAL